MLYEMYDNQPVAAVQPFVLQFLVGRCCGRLRKNEIRSVAFESEGSLLHFLHTHRCNGVNIFVSDSVGMWAAICGKDNGTMLRRAISSWFFQALGRPVLHSDVTAEAGKLCFRLVLAECELDELGELANWLRGKQEPELWIRSQLLAVLPGLHEAMIELSASQIGDWMEVTGACVPAVVLQAAVTLAPQEPDCDCSCFLRKEPSARPGTLVLREIRNRGAQFQLHPDGSASVLVFPEPSEDWLLTCIAR